MDVVKEKHDHKKNMAFQRLHAVLEIWEQDKVAGDWLYVCARRKGEKLRAIWINSDEDSSQSVEQSLAEVLKRTTAFEVELLHLPEVRQLRKVDKNKWNSLRGTRAVEIDFGGKTTRWAATDMLARNLSFSAVIKRHLAEVDAVLDPNSPVRVTLYKSKQWYCANTPSREQVTPVEMFRGNRLVGVSLISRESVLKSAQAMTRWLAAQVSDSGAANYKYWPSLGAYASSNNAIRQWMATVCLNRAAKAFGSDQLAAIAAKNLAFNLSETYKNDGAQSYIWMDGSAKLGAAALAALAIFESPRRKAYIGAEYALNDLIDSLSNQDGSFDTFYIPRERKDNQNFYSGEALLFLASRFSASRNSVELDRIMAAFSYYRDWHRKNRNPAFVPWHTQAYFLVWQVTKDDALRDFIFEMNDWLLSMQQWETAEFPDMQGRFYDPDRPYFGPPHASSTGVYLEGLIDAFWLAKQCGEQPRAEAYRVAIVCGIRSLMQLQYKESIDCFYVKNVKCVLGGLRTTVYDNTIRIDNVQHGLMALLKLLPWFSKGEYRPESLVL